MDEILGEFTGSSVGSRARHVLQRAADLEEAARPAPRHHRILSRLDPQ